MRSLALAVGIGLLTAACGGEREQGSSERTELRVTVWSEGRDRGASETWTLLCDPPGGTHPAPEAACRALAANPGALRPVPPDVVCTQVYGGPQVARVSGRYRGREIDASFNRTNGCEIDRWNRLSPLFATEA